jgi:hypothetical protein
MTITQLLPLLCLSSLLAFSGCDRNVTTKEKTKTEVKTQGDMDDDLDLTMTPS